MTTNTLETNLPLKVTETAQVKRDLALDDPTLHLSAQDEKSLDQKADEFVNALLEDESRKTAVAQMGLETQKRAARQSELLKKPIRAMAARGDEKGDVGNALVSLKMKVEELDPGKFDLEPGWFARTVGRLPGVGTPLKRYFSKYESAQTAINAIVRSLENGRDQLLRDNVTLTEDQKQMRDATHRLEQAIRLGQLIDQKLQYKMERDFASDETKKKFVGEELLFPLRQRIMDLQQQLAVNQQGVLATELIMRNNQELARGVNRALNVTITALEVGATVAMALADQKIVLDKVNAVSKTTSDLIAGTAARLKTQGVEIQKQASSAQLDLNSLRSAFADLKSAMDDVATFRMNALPQMATTVNELDQLSAEAEQTIRKMEQAKAAAPTLKIDVEA